MTPRLSDFEGNEPSLRDLMRLSSVSSLASKGWMRGLGEGLCEPDDDGRIVFVRGTYYRRDILRAKICDARYATFTLSAEPDNPADINAVAVLLDDEKVGYIPREIAPEVQPLVIAGICRVAATGLFQPTGEDNFTISLLLVWKVAALNAVSCDD